MRHTPFPWTWRLAAALTAIALAAVLMTGCEIAEPKLPVFTTQVAVPIGYERLDIADIVDDEEYLVVMPDHQLGFRVAGDPDTVSLDFDLTADVPPQSMRSDLGDFDLAPSSAPSMNFTLGKLYPAAIALDGTTPQVPGFIFDRTSAGEDLADVTSATVASGSVIITVTNGLPVPLSSALPEPEQMRVTLVDPADSSTVVTIPVDQEIPAGGTVQIVADMSGVVLPGQLAVRLTGGSHGSGGDLVPVDASAALGVDVSFEQLVVSRAEAVIGAQQASSSFDIDLPENYGVLQADIVSGAMTVTMDNELAIPCRAVVVWPEVFAPGGDTLSVTLDLGPMATGQASVDFTGCRVQAAGPVPLIDLHAEVRITSPGSSGQTVTVVGTQGVGATVSGTQLTLDQVTGTLPPLDFDFDPVNEDIDLPEELAGIELQRATLLLKVTNTSGAETRCDLLLTGTAADGATVSLPIQENLVAGGVTTVVRDETNSAIVDFLNNLPTRITLTGGVQAGGDGLIATVASTDLAVIQWEILSPVEVIISSSRLYGDYEPLGLDENIRDLIDGHVLGARAQLEVRNHLPLGIEARLLFSPDTTTIKTAPLMTVGPVTVAAGERDPVTHAVSEPVISRPVITLSPVQTKLLATPDLYTMLEIVLLGTDGEPARVLITDFVTVTGLIQLEVEVSDVDQ